MRNTAACRHMWLQQQQCNRSMPSYVAAATAVHGMPWTLQHTPSVGLLPRSLVVPQSLSDGL
jgi:hypothetical protein